jgi:tyrosinase
MEFRYWDWSLDAEDVPKSAIWDAKTGFGGDGSLNKTEPTYGGRSFRKCVNDGPFKDLYPMYFGGDYTPHCLSRGWNDGSENVGKMFSDNYTKEAVNKIQEVKSYDEYRQQLEAGPHGAIHSAMGGDMIPNTSPNGTITPVLDSLIDKQYG